MLNSGKNCLSNDLNSKCTNDIDIGFVLTCGDGEQGISIQHGMGRADSESQAILGHLSDFIGLYFVEPGVGGNNANDCVLGGSKIED